MKRLTGVISQSSNAQRRLLSCDNCTREVYKGDEEVPMVWLEPPYTIPLIAASAISAMLGLYTWWRFRGPKATTGALLMLAGSEWILTVVLEMESTSLSAKLFWSKMQYVGIVVLPMCWLISILQHTGKEKWVTFRNLAWLSIVPCITLLLVFTNQYHGLAWNLVEPVTLDMNQQLVKTFSIGFWIFIAYSYVLILIATIVLVQILVSSPSLSRWHVTAVLLAAFFPWVASALYLLGSSPFPRIGLIPLGVTVVGLVAVWSFVNWRLAGIVPVACKTVIDSMGDGVMVLDPENCIMNVNPIVQQLTGFTAQKLAGQPIEKVWPHWLDQIEPDLIEGEKEIAIDQGDEHHIYDVRISPLTDWHGGLISKVVVLRDITERKKAETLLHESEEKFRTIFEHANDEIIYMDKNGVITDVNKKFGEILGYKREEVVGKNFVELNFLGKENIDIMVNLFNDVVAKGGTALFIPMEFKHKNGRRVFTEVSTRVIKKNGEIEGFLSMVRDVTERKKAEEEIKASLKEKEVLLREIHHRVKNNLQVISSLLSLQSRYIRDNQYTEMLKESQDRVRSMALIYEKLYQSEDLASIDFNEYIKTLVKDLFRSYRVSTEKTVLKIKVDDISLGIDAAIPCGLIINELVSNSLKHAFPEGEGEITMTLRTINENIELVVSDNGVGIPEDIDFRNTESLGLRLVTILAEGQLNGSIDLDRTKGTTFFITFRVNQNEV